MDTETERKREPKYAMDMSISVGVLHRACLPRYITQHSNGTCTHCYACILVFELVYLYPLGMAGVVR